MENNNVQNADKKDTHEIHTNNKTFFQTFIEGNLLQIITLTVGVVMAGVVGYFTISVFPFLQKLEVLTVQVQANTGKIEEQTKTNDTIIRLDENVKNIGKDIINIQDDIRFLIQK